MADPEFPVGGGAADLRRGYFSAKTHVKIKEFDPGRGACRRRPPLDPPMTVVISYSTCHIYISTIIKRQYAKFHGNRISNCAVVCDKTQHGVLVFTFMKLNSVMSTI